jgi:hypothetical protein
MERAAGLAAARSISRELYYHRYTSDVKCEVLWAVSHLPVTQLIVSYGGTRVRSRARAVNQAGCSSEPIRRGTSGSDVDSDSGPLARLLVSGNNAVNRPRAGRNAHTS